MVNALRVGDESPWGEIDYLDQIAEGIYQVETPSHGGVMMDVHSDFVKEDLSDPAWDVGEGWHNWLCFEEDAAYAVAFWELLNTESDLDWYYEPYENDPDRLEEIWRTAIELYYPEYAEAML